MAGRPAGRLAVRAGCVSRGGEAGELVELRWWWWRWWSPGRRNIACSFTTQMGRDRKATHGATECRPRPGDVGPPTAMPRPAPTTGEGQSTIWGPPPLRPTSNLKHSPILFCTARMVYVRSRVYVTVRCPSIDIE